MSNSEQEKIEYLIADLALRAPELAPCLARLSFRACPEKDILVHTGGRSSVGWIRVDGTGEISSELVAERPDLAVMVLGHEALHLVAESAGCRIERLVGADEWDGDHERANRAVDRWINQILLDLRVCTTHQVKTMEGLLPPEGGETLGFVELWRLEKTAPRSRGGKGSAPSMAGCSPASPEEGGEIKGSVSETEGHSVLAGLASVSPAARATACPPPPVVRWQDVLHEAAACSRGLGLGSRPRPTRARLGRRSSEELPKPGATTRRPQIVVVADISGSMGGFLDQLIGECAGLERIASVHLILHDAAVLFSGPCPEGRRKIGEAGGTTFGPAIQEADRVARAWNGKTVVIHLTDGYPGDKWPPVPDGTTGYVALFGDCPTGAVPPGWRVRRASKGG